MDPVGDNQGRGQGGGLGHRGPGGPGHCGQGGLGHCGPSGRGHCRFGGRGHTKEEEERHDLVGEGQEGHAEETEQTIQGSGPPLRDRWLRGGVPGEEELDEAQGEGAQKALHLLGATTIS